MESGRRCEGWEGGDIGEAWDQVRNWILSADQGLGSLRRLDVGRCTFFDGDVCRRDVKE